MDLAYFHLWSAGYLLPTTPTPIVEPPKPVKRRGKKAARAKRERVTE